MEPEHFLLDIDGCLRAGAINELPGLEIIQHYLKRAREENLPLISLCTGRGRGYGEAMHQNIGAPDTFSIFENGCFMERLTSTPRELVEHDKVKENRDTFAQIASFLGSYADQKGYYREPKEVMVTISVKGTGKSPEELDKEITQELNRRGWLNVVMVAHSTTAVDVTPQGVSKATGVLAFAKYLQLDPRGLCGVGDSEADCEFLRLVGFAGCPSNAQKCVQEVVRSKIKEYGGDYGFLANRPDIYGIVEILEHFNRSRKVHLLETIIPSLSTVQAIRDRATFMATRVRKQVSLDGREVCYEIDEDPHVATTQDQRTLLESPIDEPTEGTFWRWPAGGALIVLKDRKKGCFCPVVLRDARAPVDWWCFGTGAGLGASENDFLFPNRAAVREAMEETVVCIGQKIAYPFIRDDKWGGMNLAIEEVARKNHALAEKLGRSIDDVIPVPASLLPLEAGSIYKVKWGDKVLELPGMFVEDKNNGAVDYLCAIEMDLGEHSIDEVVLLDGEMPGATPLWREMYLFELLEAGTPGGYTLGKVRDVFQKGASVKRNRSSCWEECRTKDKIGRTPGLRKILECLRLPQ